MKSLWNSEHETYSSMKPIELQSINHNNDTEDAKNDVELAQWLYGQKANTNIIKQSTIIHMETYHE